MKPIPVVFHLGPLQVHTYGIGLAVTFWFGYRYFERRLRRNGYSTEWLVGMFLWVVVAAVVGARLMHVLANLSYYEQAPSQVLQVWHGGLSSWGGLLFGIPTAVLVTRRRCPSLRLARALDLVAPVLMAAWAVGRLLGPQLMVAGGGHPTAQWFGMYYAGQVGKRLPVPVFQAMEDVAVFLVLLAVERRCNRWPDGSPRAGYPPGVVLGTGMVLWGIERAVDQHLWLSGTDHLGSALVQLAGVALTVAGLVVLAMSGHRWRIWLAAGATGAGDGPLAAAVDAADPPPTPGSASGGAAPEGPSEGTAVTGAAVAGGRTG